MPVLKIRNKQVEVDVEQELRGFEWGRAKWTGDKLIAASPFRDDATPSFFVNLAGDYVGCFGDSGAYDIEWQSGNFVKLISYLRRETYEESEEYLLGLYDYQDDMSSHIKLRPIKLNIQRVRQFLDKGLLEEYTTDYSYLKKRGISEQIQNEAGIRYDSKSSSIVIPWFTSGERLANIKFRKVSSKIFWYERGACPIRELVFGLERAGPTTVLCEAEIDALSFRQAGFAAIAVGGASFNDYKRDLILRSPIEDLVIATDNDKAGEKLRREVEAALSGKIRLKHAHINKEVKDANEALVRFGVQALRDAVDRSEKCQQLYLKVSTTFRGK